MDLEGRCFVKRNGVWTPADFAAQEFTDTCPEGKEVIFTVRKARSPEHHRWFFGWLRIIVDNTEGKWSDETDLLEDLKEAVGLSSTKVNPLTGKETTRRGSIAWANMGQDRFARFVRRCSYVVGQALGWNPETLMEEADDLQRPADLPPERRRRRWWHKRERRPARSADQRRRA